MSESEKPNLLMALPALSRAVREAAKAEQTMTDIARVLDITREEAIERVQRALDAPVKPLAKVGPRADEDGSYGVFGP